MTRFHARYHREEGSKQDITGVGTNLLVGLLVRQRHVFAIVLARGLMFMGDLIALLTPELGFELALQVAGLSVSVGVGGIGCVFVASNARSTTPVGNTDAS